MFTLSTKNETILKGIVYKNTFKTYLYYYNFVKREKA